MTIQDRLFLALWPEAVATSALEKLVDAWHWDSGARRYLPQDWHLTLWFFGAVQPERVPVLAAGLAVPFEPFEFALDQARCWPHGLAVCTTAAVPPPLASLRERLGRAAARLGLPLDARPFHPHVTLARHAQAAIVPAAAFAVSWPVGAYALVRSSGNAQRRYEPLKVYPAASRPSGPERGG